MNIIPYNWNAFLKISDKTNFKFKIWPLELPSVACIRKCFDKCYDNVNCWHIAGMVYFLKIMRKSIFWHVTTRRNGVIFFMGLFFGRLNPHTWLQHIWHQNHFLTLTYFYEFRCISISSTYPSELVGQYEGKLSEFILLFRYLSKICKIHKIWAKFTKSLIQIFSNFDPQ